MDLLEYIKRNYETPNPYIIKDLGGSEELIEYLRDTPWNTNLNMLGSLGSGRGGDTGEVWLVGDNGTEYQGMKLFELSNVGEVNHMAELVANGESYSVFLDGIELPHYEKMEEDSYIVVTFTDAVNWTKNVAVYSDNGENSAQATYGDALTAPTSVEVSVKAK